VTQCVAACCTLLHYAAASRVIKLRYGKFESYGAFSSVLQRVAVCCSVLQCVALRCSVLQCVVVFSSVLQRVAACCSVLQCVAVRCSAL